MHQLLSASDPAVTEAIRTDLQYMQTVPSLLAIILCCGYYVLENIARREDLSSLYDCRPQNECLSNCVLSPTWDCIEH